MTVPSLQERVALSVSAWTPEIDAGTSYDPMGTLVTDRIGDWLSALTFEIATNGGYKAATITFQDRQVDIDDWIASGIGRHVEVYDPALVKIWEGVVNSYTASIGPLAVTGGPLLDIGNRASVVYTPILDATVDPPVVGVRQPTTIAEDSDSQDRYGIVEKVLSGGTCFEADAERYRDTFVAENALPQVGEQLMVGQGQIPVITLECLGYSEWLRTYVYNDTNTGTRSLSDKITDVLGGDPNGLFSTDYSHIDTNSYLTTRQENDDALAWDIIQAVVALGDASDNRWVFGMYNDQVAWYNQVPTTVLYQHRLADPAQRIELYGSGTLVRPWDVRPGEWVFLPDYLVGRTQPTTNLRSDPRNVFIESVRYTAPYSVEIVGQKVGNLGQLAAKLGLGGATS
jgi:hypothetical protein